MTAEVLSVEKVLAEAMRDADGSHLGWECCAPPTHADAAAILATEAGSRLTLASPECETCSGKGWYATGPTDAPEQVQCDDCLGTGKAPELQRLAAIGAAVERLPEMSAIQRHVGFWRVQMGDTIKTGASPVEAIEKALKP